MMKTFVDNSLKIRKAVKFVVAACWGLMLLLPGNAFDNETPYRALSVIAPDYIWGSIAVTIALLYFVFYSSQEVKKVIIFLLMVFWLFVTLSVAAFNPASTALYAYAGYFVLTTVDFLRANETF